MEKIVSLCTKYGVDMAHARDVAQHALAIFDATQVLHKRSVRASELLEAGALLHNVGLVQDVENHHIAGRDIIIVAPLEGFEPAERAMLACIVLFHRRSVNAVREPLFVALSASEREDTLHVAAIMRVADGLDRSQSQTTAIDEICITTDGALLIRTSGPHSHEDAAAAARKADLWRDLVGPLRAHGRLTAAGIAADMPLTHAARRILQYHADQIMPDPQMDEWASFDVGAWPAPRVKTMRIAVRRIRQDLRIFADQFKRRPAYLLAKGARSLASVLSDAREMDMLLARAKDFTRAVASDSTPDSARPPDALDAPDAPDALIDEWKAQRRAARNRLSDYLQTDGHVRWCRLLAECVADDDFCKRRSLKVGEPSLVRHSMHVLLCEHLRAVKAYDVLPDVPSPTDLHAVRIVVKRLRYFVDALQEVLSPDQARAILNACVEAQRTFGEANDAHMSATRALEFVAADRTLHKSTLKGIVFFADAQQHIVDEQTSQWRALLQPFLHIDIST